MSFRRPSSDTRGQGLVEFALILPLLAVFLVMAVDAGRLFFGWVALQNASRIGADFASTHADAWGGNLPAGAQDRARYVLLIQQDLQALGCEGDTPPPPNFDLDGDGTSDYSDGALARVDLYCDFIPLTPLAEAFIGQPLVLHSFSDFAINRSISGGLPAPSNPPPLPSANPSACAPGEAMVPNLLGQQNQDAFAAWTGAGFNGANYSPAVTNQNKNRRVQTQSLAPDSCQPLTAAMAVTLN